MTGFYSGLNGRNQLMNRDRLITLRLGMTFYIVFPYSIILRLLFEFRL